jgi:enamine deaminase RidA (YjgF/YER057c/UK114 family)
VDRAVNDPERARTSPHRIVDPEALARPSGYSHAVVAAPGRMVYLAGQTGHRKDDSIAEGVVEQFEDAVANVVRALEAAGGRPEDLVSMQIFTTDLAGYLAASVDIGAAYRRHFGKHFGANALIEVKGLVGGAKVELMCVAVIPGSYEAEG